MPRRQVSLSDLQETMRKYREMLARTKGTQAYTAGGDLRDVDEERVRRAVASLDAAIADVGGLCQDAVLAVMVDTE